MFGIFRTNGVLRAQLRASHARIDKNNATIQGLRKLLNDERRKSTELAQKAAEVISELQWTMARRDPSKTMKINPSVPQPLARNVIHMQSRTVAPTDAPINHGGGPDLSTMMLAGLLVSEDRGDSAIQQREPEPATSSGGGGDFSGAGASSSWGDSSSDSSSSSSDFSSSSSD